MNIEGDTLDDLLYAALTRILKKGIKTTSTKGGAREIIGAKLTLKNPRARFSHAESRATLFSCLGELLWYLSGSKELSFIRYYIPRYREASDNNRTLNGAYGPRIFLPKGSSQFDTVANILKTKKSDSRQAIIQILDKKDISKFTKDVPCTCTLHFLKRGKKLHLVTSMRSNDAFIGLPHDFFAFTMIQEIMARTISCELGNYHHFASSLHLYDGNESQALNYLSEGFQESAAMPPMPPGDPWTSISWLLEMEARVRAGNHDPIPGEGIDPYWTDLARLLRIKLLYTNKDLREVVKEIGSMSSPIYNGFIRGRARKISNDVHDAQMKLTGII